MAKLRRNRRKEDPVVVYKKQKPHKLLYINMLLTLGLYIVIYLYLSGILKI